MEELRLSDEDAAHIAKLGRMYRREAQKCLNAKSYLAACAMLGAALEAALILMCDVYFEEIPKDLMPMAKNRQKPILKWSLDQLVRVARKVRWLPAGLDLESEWSNRRAKIGDYAIVLKDYRNLVHPNRYTSDFKNRRVTRRRAELCYEVLDACIDHLLNRNDAALRKAMEKEALV
jgi:hypothetical protein